MHHDLFRLSAIVESSDDAIISKTLEGIITSWNKSAERMLGYKEEEIIGKHITVLIPKERLQEETVIMSMIRKGEKVDHFETIRVAKDGSMVPISLTVSPIKDLTGKIIGASKIARDISQQIEAREKINLYNQQLEKANLYKDEFIGIASHELKTPLTSIYGYLQILEKITSNDENAQEFTRKTIRQVNKLNAMVTDLLDVSKIHAGKLQLNIRPFKLMDLLTEAIEVAQQLSASHKIDLELKCGNMVIEGDQQRLEQVLLNILSNAVKYSPSQNRVIVTAKQEKDMLVISIQDFGIGVPKIDHQKIFNRFYRVDSLKPIYSGMGIGLYISSEIIQMHHGNIWVESIEGKGATFAFSIPLKHEAQVESAQ